MTTVVAVLFIAFWIIFVLYVMEVRSRRHTQEMLARTHKAAQDAQKLAANQQKQFADWIHKNADWIHKNRRLEDYIFEWNADSKMTLNELDAAKQKTESAQANKKKE